MKIARRHVPLRWFIERVLVTADPDNGAPLLLLGADGYGRESSRACCTGRAPRWRWPCSSTLFATLIGALRRRHGGLCGRMARQPALARLRIHPGAAGDLRGAGAARGDAARPSGLDGLPVAARASSRCSAGRSWPAASARSCSSSANGNTPSPRAQPAPAVRGSSPSPAARRRGLPGTQATLLLPAFILAEATMSYVGLGFPDTTPTWGTMLQDAANVALLGDAPWTLAPAAAIFMVVLGVNLLGAEHGSRACTIGAMTNAVRGYLHADRHAVSRRRHRR